MNERLKVLTVDDEPGMCSGIERSLRGFKVEIREMDVDVSFDATSAGSGEAAIEMVNADVPDIILLDYKMPGMTGLDVMARLEEDGRDILIIMITAFASIQTAVAATKRGAFDFLPKPFTPEELRQVVDKATRHVMTRREAMRLAEEKRRVRFEFISVLAHELKAPLGAIEGYLNLMKDEALGPEIAPYQSQVSRCLIRLDGMKKLIFDLLDLTRIESGRRERQLVTIDLLDVARTALETAKPMADERSIILDVHAPGPVPFVGDRSEMEIIFNNLVSNAVKYNRDTGRVDVTLSVTPEAITLSVADTGIGMAPEDVNRLFREFVRIKNAKTRNILGSGLGLSILKKLVDMYQGSISVNSQVDQGTTFTVVFPRGVQEIL
jgi:signal transduction histidine kinase